MPRCIAADAEDLAAWANAAMAALKLERWHDAARSAAHVVLHTPPSDTLHVKALYRQGLAYVHMGGRMHEAKRTVQALQRISPRDAAKVGFMHELFCRSRRRWLVCCAHHIPCCTAAGDDALI